MPLFVYQYLNEKEQKKKSIIDALNLEDAKEKLRKQKILFFQVKEKKTCYNKKVPLLTLAIFSKQLAVLLRSGLPLYESLKALQEQYQTNHFGDVIRQIIESIRNGATLSDALAKHPEIFDDFYCSSICAGESVGNLENALIGINRILEDKDSFRKKILSTLAYPLVLITFSVFVIFLFLLGVIPSLKEVFENNQLNLITRMVFSLSDGLIQYAKIIILSIGLALSSLILFRKKIGWKYFLEKLGMAVPFIRHFYVKLSLGKFALLVSAVLKGGGTFIKALEIGNSSIPCCLIRSDMRNIIQKIIAGSSFSKELSKTSWAPNLAKGMIALGEESGDLEGVFEHLAKIYNEETQKTLSWISSWSQPIILIVLGGVIGFIMLGILIPLTSSSNLF